MGEVLGEVLGLELGDGDVEGLELTLVDGEEDGLLEGDELGDGLVDGLEDGEVDGELDGLEDGEVEGEEEPVTSSFISIIPPNQVEDPLTDQLDVYDPVVVVVWVLPTADNPPAA